ncbi:uncharacterized protein CLUP02_02624 [Colletotrichum lupini]|uniref:Uncharacterized protein n=1 Tax=Colletotrichum lupini TaxID=145971 RepID=A0A9Q8SGV3_9PEZI|nr:uncharacterized protein CLUP02_02624 [Colletotrichum lupini]UQC77157.1 hypothetical protein CLUP02_02624 [Colletotrichum lupini]
MVPYLSKYLYSTSSKVTKGERDVVQAFAQQQQKEPKEKERTERAKSEVHWRASPEENLATSLQLWPISAFCGPQVTLAATTPLQPARDHSQLLTPLSHARDSNPCASRPTPEALKTRLSWYPATKYALRSTYLTHTTQQSRQRQQRRLLPPELIIHHRQPKGTDISPDLKRHCYRDHSHRISTRTDVLPCSWRGSAGGRPTSPICAPNGLRLEHSPSPPYLSRHISTAFNLNNCPNLDSKLVTHLPRQSLIQAIDDSPLLHADEPRPRTPTP